MKDKYGFTLVELLGVFVLLGLVMMLLVPSLLNLKNSNQRKQYTTYEDMMVEYTKVIPGYKNKSYVCLKELNMKEISSNITCQGYVIINNNKLVPYLSCVNKNGETLYTTSGYSLPSDC